MSLCAVALVKALTFSITTRGGSRSAASARCVWSVITACIFDHSPERVSGRRPARRPATLMSWQGNPPLMMSTSGASPGRMAFTSPQFGTPGQRWASTWEAARSCSHIQTVRAP